MSASAGMPPDPTRWLHGRVTALDAASEPASIRLRGERDETAIRLARPLARTLVVGAIVRVRILSRGAPRSSDRSSSDPELVADALEILQSPTLRSGESPEWASASSHSSRVRLRERSLLLATLRDCFAREGFLEVETPSLLAAPGQEPHLRPFATRFHSLRGARPLWLATSPEYAMKRLLALGFERVYQLGRAWRDGPDELSPLHAPEFTLLEWYRAYAGLETIASDVSRLLGASARALTGATSVARAGRSCDLAAPPEWLSVADAFRRFAQVDLAPYLDGDDAAFVRGLPAEVRVAGEDARARADSAFFKILIDRVEPRLGLERPTLLWLYPARHAALSALDPVDRRVARRFEIYVLGVELGNAFDELRDAREQERRLHAESEERVRAGGEALPIDEEFLSALRSGLPPCAGIALGVDRLQLLIAGAERLADLLAFPFREPA